METWVDWMTVGGLAFATGMSVLGEGWGIRGGAAALWLAVSVHGLTGVGSETVSWDSFLVWAVFGWLACLLYCVIVQGVCDSVLREIVRPLLRRLANGGRGARE